MQIHIENAVTILCGGDSALNGIANEDGRMTPGEIAGWETLEGLRVHEPDVCAVHPDCVFERFAQMLHSRLIQPVIPELHMLAAI